MYTGKLVLLRSFDAADLNALCRFLNDPVTMRLLTDGAVMPATMEDTARWMQDQTWPSGGVYQFALEALEDGQFIGRCGFVQIDRKNRHGEIAIHLGEKRGRGRGADAVRLLCRFGFTELGLHRITARTFDFNVACARCLEKCGFEQEGFLRDELYRDGAWHGVRIYGLIAPTEGGTRETKGV